ncbi:zinc ribbon domain-containing protein [Dyella japonica]|nr:zinc ribbon domain-containing protein [Dyella japonica]
MKCENCGEVTGDERFCGACGHALAPSFSLPMQELATADSPRTPLGGSRPAASEAKRSSPDVSVGPFALSMALYFVAIFVSYYGFVKRDVPIALGWALGGCIIWPGLIVGISRLLGARRPRRSMLICVPILSVLSFLGTSSQHGDAADKKQLHEAVVAIQAQERGDATAISPQAPPQQSPGSRADGTQSLPQAMSNIAGRMHDQLLRNKERHDQMAALHIETALRPASLVRAESIADSRERLEKYFQIQQQMFADYDETSAAAKDELSRLPPGEREQALAGLARTRPRAVAAMGNFKRVEQQLHADFTEILDLADANLGKTREQDGKIYLPPAALQAYRRLVGDVRDLTQQEANVRDELRSIQADSEQMLGKLEQETRGS